MVLFQLYDKVYFALSEFGWSPDTTWEEFARRYILRRFRVKDEKKAQIYKKELKSKQKAKIQGPRDPQEAKKYLEEFSRFF